MTRMYLIVIGLFFSAALPGLLIPAWAATGSDEEMIPAETKGAMPSSVATHESTPVDLGNVVDAFDVDPESRVFWTKGELKMGVEKWYGDNTYQVGFPVYDYATRTLTNGYFPFSELEFPLDVVMFSAQYDLEIKKRWMLSFSFKSDLDHSGDDMEDSDWITASNPDQLDIYSTSNVTDFEAYEYDVNVRFKYLMGATWSLDAGVGYLFQKYKYDTALKTQYSPSGLAGYDFVWDGRTSSLKYDLYYRIPYLQMGGSVTFAKRFTIIASASYAPWVEGEDEDQHLLRGLVAKTELDGDCWMANLEARYQINRNWFASLEYGYKKIEVDGKSYDSYYWGLDPNDWVWLEQESTQHSGSLMVGYNF